jgi:hypothetical protein
MFSLQLTGKMRNYREKCEVHRRRKCDHTHKWLPEKVEEKRYRGKRIPPHFEDK